VNLFVRHAVVTELPDFANPSLENTVKLKTSKDNKLVFNLILRLLLKYRLIDRDPKHILHGQLSLMIPELVAVKIYKIAKSDDNAVYQKTTVRNIKEGF